MGQSRDLSVVKHEAAHVVVGAAVGLRLRRAVVGHCIADGGPVLGYAWFSAHGPDYAHALMYAAGPAWEKSLGSQHLKYCKEDLQLCRELVKSDSAVRACVRAARAMLRGLKREHACVVAALCERDITGKDLLALARGERFQPDLL